VNSDASQRNLKKVFKVYLLKQVWSGAIV
jgi:hypothetical protein